MKIEFSKYAIKTKSEGASQYIYDIIRKKWIVLTPEEQVRQVWLHYLINDQGISESKIAVEKGLKINGKIKRFDICIYDNSLSPLILIECKSPQIKLSTPALEQMSVYNIQLGARVFVLTNGISHLGFKILPNEVKKLEQFIFV